MADLKRLSERDLQKRISTRAATFDALQKDSDPGAGKSPKEAEKLRQAQLKKIERVGSELDALRAESAAREPDPMRSPGVMEKFRRINRHAIINADRPMEEREAARALQEAAVERDRQRAAKREIAKLAERRKHPAHPQAESIVAAVAADPKLFDGLRRRLRPVSEGEGQQRAFRAYDYEDVGVLFTVLHLLREHGRVVVRNVSTSAVFADPELPQIPRLGQTLAHLRKNGWLVATFEGSTGYYAYGPKVRKIAEKWGLDLPAAVVEEPEAVVTRS